MGFIENIKDRAKNKVQTIVLPEALDIRTLQAAEEILREKIADIILIGSEKEIMEKADGLDISGAKIVDPNSFDEMDAYVELFAELRSKKGMTTEKAREILLEDELYLGVMMVKKGRADGMVAGAANATADVLRPSLQILKTSPGTKLVSTFFVMVVPNCEYGSDGTFVFSDCGLVQNPNAEELAAIAGSSARSFEILVEEKPVVGLLSHSTMGSANHADVDKVVEATRLAKEAYPGYAIDGEFQLDAAIVPSIGQAKAPGNEVAGNVNVLIFPDLDAGNIGYKLVQRLAKAEAYGPVTQGIAKPVNDLSRGCSFEDIVGVVAITAVQAIDQNK
nr:phosphate acetyltransferase [Tissierella sp.]